jgi:glycosyltransferase involved in cell wall biosynthesis
MGSGGKLLMIHQFALPSISGVSVMNADLLRLIPTAAPGIRVASQSYEGFKQPGDLMAVLQAQHADATCVVGANLHIEVGWGFSLAVAKWCQLLSKPLYLHLHDYWPHHRDAITVLQREFGARLLAITPAIVEELAADGFAAELLPVGINVSASPVAVVAPAEPKTVASVGRLVQRKHFADTVRAFCLADLGPGAVLYLRLPPSLVYTPEQDRARLREVRAELRACRARSVVRISRRPRLGTDYTHWSVYVCASEYEGVSMTPIEAAMQGCPPLMSDIAPHRAIVNVLFPGRDAEFIFPVGDCHALAALLRDEVLTGRRRAELAARRAQFHALIERVWSLRNTARALAALAQDPAVDSAFVAATASQRGLRE